jgi:hypothetical protein
MEIKKVKNKTYGDYYRATTTLWVKGKPFKVTQDRRDPNKQGYKWDLRRSQMLKILEMTEPSDWLYRYCSFLNDWQWEPPNGEFKPMTPESLNWVKKYDLDSKRDRAQFITGEKDEFGNQMTPGTFEIWNEATHHVVLKPTNNFIKLDL